MHRLGRVLLVVLVAAAGCGGSDAPESDLDTQAPPVEVAADAETPASPDSTSDEMDIFTVTQAGDGCAVSGPTEVRADQVYYFILKDPSESARSLYVGRLTEGKTFQDLLEPQTSPGDPYPSPSWLIHAEPDGFAMVEFSETADLSDDERAYAFSVEPGPHAIFTHSGELGELWFCAPFQAT